MVLVSATLPHEVLEMTHKFMTDPVRILVKRDELTLEVRSLLAESCTVPSNPLPPPTASANCLRQAASSVRDAAAGCEHSNSVTTIICSVSH